jgi:nicotinate phosphoribosyltransferase
MGTFPPTGVVPQLVRNVREALDANGYAHVKIVVSGGFDANKIRVFEEEDVPVDAYAVGSAFFEGTGRFDYTADIVAIERAGRWTECHKAGRPERPNPRLSGVT